MRRSNRIALFLGVCALFPACRSADTHAGRLTAEGAGRIVEIVEVRTQSDTNFRRAIVAPDGTEWYGAAAPRLTLDSFDASRSFVDHNPWSGWFIRMFIREASGDDFGRWMDDHIGDRVAVIFDGKCRGVAQMVQRITETLVVGPFENEQEAEGACAKIQALGHHGP